jgi:hypothetical protein
MLIGVYFILFVHSSLCYLRCSYVFLIFNQPPGFDSQTLVTPNTSISNFNLSSFAAATGLGAPIGGTFMLVAPDPSTATSASASASASA